MSGRDDKTVIEAFSHPVENGELKGSIKICYGGRRVGGREPGALIAGSGVWWRDYCCTPETQS